MTTCYPRPLRPQEALSESFNWDGVPTTYVRYNSHDGWHKFESLMIPDRHFCGPYHEIPTERVPELHAARKGYRCSGMPTVAKSQDRGVLLRHAISGEWTKPEAAE